MREKNSAACPLSFQDKAVPSSKPTKLTGISLNFKS